MKKYIANMITCSRILGSVMMLFTSAFSPPFYAAYIFCGLTDMLDGPVARKTGTVTKFGSRLDSAADVIFAVIVLAKVLPAMDMPVWLWCWIMVIAAIKIAGMVQGFLCKKKWIAVHSVMNKITGLILFLLPISFPFIELKYSAPVICAIATFSAVQEEYYIRTGQEWM